MTAETPKTVFLKDYRPPPFLIEDADLHFELGEDSTLVTSALTISRNSAFGDPRKDLKLDGRELELVSLEIDGAAVGDDGYRVDDGTLTIRDVPDAQPVEAGLGDQLERRADDRLVDLGIPRSTGGTTLPGRIRSLHA